MIQARRTDRLSLPDRDQASLGLAYFDAILIDAQERKAAKQLQAAKAADNPVSEDVSS
jgi:hypothetical protein